MKRTIQYAGLFALLALGPLVHPLSQAQVQVGDDLRMNLSAGHCWLDIRDYGDQIPSNHAMNFGGDAVF